MSDDLIPNQVLALITIVGGLICVYASDISIIGGILAIVLAALATVFGTNTLRFIGNYSLGTGIPSIVYLLTSVGLISYLLAIAISMHFANQYLFPIMSVISAIILSLIVSLICKHVFGIKVEILTKSFIYISISSVLLITAMSILLAQSYNPITIYENLIQNGLIILLMILSVMVIQNPYNSCMGPNEDQYRTLALALVNVFLVLIIISTIAMLTTNYWILYLVLSLIGFIISLRFYLTYTKHQAASIKRYGLWPKDDGEI